MPKLTPDEEKQVCEVLIRLSWVATEHALHSEGVRVVRDVLQCSTEDAKEILGDLRTRKLVGLEITPGEQLDARKPMPVGSGDGFAQRRAISASLCHSSQSVGRPL
jgi:hypothetical protein